MSPFPFKLLSDLSQRLGLAGNPYSPRQLFDRASALKLSKPSLPTQPDNINWNHGLAWQAMPHLSRDALSGPEQYDKIAAREALLRLIQTEHLPTQNIDIRNIDGMASNIPIAGVFGSMEAYLQSLPSRRIRIISQNDFRQALAIALPQRNQGRPLTVVSANWRGERLYLNKVQDPEALARAIVYARKRGLNELLTVRRIDYRVTEKALDELASRYHFLCITPSSWKDQDLLTILVDSRLPYARLRFTNAGENDPEYLLLPQNNALSKAIGDGLLLAGAPDLITSLKQWLQQAQAKRSVVATA